MGISSFANYTIKDIRDAGLGVGPIKHGIQMYTLKDRELQLSIIQEAEKQGCTAVFLTADSPVLGVRYNEWRNDFRTPDGLDFPILGWDTERIRRQTHDDSFMNFNDDSHSWAREIPWLRSVTKMEIWIKGVVAAEDTLRAVEMGCDGIIVSNHGGRQLDGVPATIDALPECVEAAAGRIRIHVDGGIRSGTGTYTDGCNPSPTLRHIAPLQILCLRLEDTLRPKTCADPFTLWYQTCSRQSPWAPNTVGLADLRSGVSR